MSSTTSRLCAMSYTSWATATGMTTQPSSSPTMASPGRTTTPPQLMTVLQDQGWCAWGPGGGGGDGEDGEAVIAEHTGVTDGAVGHEAANLGGEKEGPGQGRFENPIDLDRRARSGSFGGDELCGGGRRADGARGGSIRASGRLRGREELRTPFW